MRAYEVGLQSGIDSWCAVSRPEPTLGPGQVLIAVRAVSLNYRDLLIARGHYPSHPAPTLIPLSDGAGEVVAVGPGVTRWQPGDRVTGIFAQSWLAGPQPMDAWSTTLGGEIDGMLAEQVVLHESGLVRLPDHLSFEEGATLPVAGVTAWNALYGLAPLKPGETVLTLGTGGVSIFGIQLAHAGGAHVIATSSSDAKLEQARALGADETINYRRHPDWQHEVRRLTGGRGVDHVIEVGGPGTFTRSLASVRLGGEVTMIGRVAVGDPIDPVAIIGGACIVRGVNVGSREMFEDMNRAISGHLIRPVIHGVYEFDQAKDALAALARGEHVGKIVVRVGN